MYINEGNVSKKLEIQVVDRNNISLAEEIVIENSYESESAEDAIGFAEKEIFDIASKQDTSSLEQMENALNKVIEKLSKLK